MTPQQLKRNNIILLVCLVVSIAIFPTFQADRVVLKHFVLASIVLSSIFCLDFSPRTRRILLPAGSAVILLLILSYFIKIDLLEIFDYVAMFAFLLLIVVFIIRHIARKENVDATIIISSVNGYLLLGVLWALLLHSTYAMEIILLEFPSAEHLRQWLTSSDYAPLGEIRKESTNSRAVVVEGYAPGSQ